jgi:hypothetical protein
MSLIQSHGFPIVIGPRDSSRNILGKVLKYLETNPAAQLKLQAVSKDAKNKSSPALERALRALMNEPA